MKKKFIYEWIDTHLVSIEPADDCKMLVHWMDYSENKREPILCGGIKEAIKKVEAILEEEDCKADDTVVVEMYMEELLKLSVAELGSFSVDDETTLEDYIHTMKCPKGHFFHDYGLDDENKRIGLFAVPDVEGNQ